MSRLPGKCRSRGAKDGQPDALIVRWQLIPQLFFEVLAKKSATTGCTWDNVDAISRARRRTYCARKLFRICYSDICR